MGTSGSAPSNVISTPKGGGALKGIGESFAADLNTGTGNFSVPLALPPGRNGLQPALRLEYSTGNGNGPFGFGWRIDVPGIARKTSKGIPRYHDETDVFVLSGMEDLVPVEVLATDSAGHARTRFQPRTEGLFAEIVHVRSPLDTYWDVIGKSLSGRELILIDSEKVKLNRNLMMFDPELFRAPPPIIMRPPLPPPAPTDEH